MKKVFLFTVVVLGLTGCTTAFTTESIPVEPIAEITNNASVAVLETGPATACTINTDCYCRSFDGSEFIEGETSFSICCDAVDGTRCPQINYCQQCTYR